MNIPAEMDEAARSILSEMVEGKRKRSLVGMKLALSEEFHIHASVQQSADLWTKYMGWDERKLPTHNLDGTTPLKLGGLLQVGYTFKPKDTDPRRDEISRFDDGDSDG